MIFVPVNPETTFKKTKLLKFLEDFVESDTAIAEIKDWEGTYKNVSSVQSSFATAIKRFNMNNVACKVSDKRVYLINKTLYKED